MQRKCMYFNCFSQYFRWKHIPPKVSLLHYLWNQQKIYLYCIPNLTHCIPRKKNLPHIRPPSADFKVTSTLIFKNRKLWSTFYQNSFNFADITLVAICCTYCDNWRCFVQGTQIIYGLEWLIIVNFNVPWIVSEQDRLSCTLLQLSRKSFTSV
jgi:hypothetical protein